MRNLVNNGTYPANVLFAVFGDVADSCAYYLDADKFESVINDIMSMFVDTDRYVFFSVYKNNLPQSEIANNLQCSEETVRYMLLRIIKKLRHPNQACRLKHFAVTVKVFSNDEGKIPVELISLCDSANVPIAVIKKGRIKAFVMSRERYDELNEQAGLIVELANKTPNAEADEMAFFKKALLLAIEDGTISSMVLQQELCIGYAHACRIIDEMEERELISPHIPGQPRKVYITKEQYNKLFGA